MSQPTFLSSLSPSIARELAVVIPANADVDVRDLSYSIFFDLSASSAPR